MYLGTFTVGVTFDFYFTTRRFTTGAPFALAGTPVISAYEDNSVTQITAGITLTVDFDGVTGLNQVRVVFSGANGYEAGKSYAFVITTGTVDSVSVVGEVVGYCHCERGDVFERLGAPAGASISADIAAIEAQTDDIGAAGAGLTALASAANLATLDGKVDTIDNFLDTEIAAILADTNELQTDWVDGGRLDLILDARASQASVNTIDDFLDTEIAAILAAVDTEVAAILALLDDARTEPGQGAPPVNPDLATKVDYLYKAWRNKKDNDGSETKLYADDGATVDQKQTTSEAAGTVTKAEWVTGP